MLRFGLGLLLLFCTNSTAFAFESVTDFEKNTNPLKALIFLSKDCPCSRSHTEHLNRLSEQFKNVSFFGVIADEFNKENTLSIEDYFSSKNFKYPIIKDSEQKLIKEFAALKTPHVNLLKRQPNGLYTRIYEGGVSDHREFNKSNTYFLNENLIALTNEKNIPHANGKSLGCYIRRL